jgi:hypothetical protein
MGRPQTKRACALLADRRERRRRHVGTGSLAEHHSIRVQEAKPHELEGKIQGDRRGRLYLAVATWNSDSDSSSYLPAQGLHLTGVKRENIWWQLRSEP